MSKILFAIILCKYSTTIDLVYNNSPLEYNIYITLGRIVVNMSKKVKKTKRELDPGKVKFGAFVQKHRNAKGYTQQEVADKLGITLKSVSYFECGLTYPSQENIFKLAEILDMSLDEYIFSCTRFNAMVDMGEVNGMLNELSPDDQEMVISIVKAACESIRNRNEKSK